MQNAEWIALFRQVPPDMHPQTVLVLNNRAEVSIEAVFRIEPAYVMIRGRMGGTTDGGLLFVVPYDQIAAVYVFRDIKEDEAQKVFGTPAGSGRFQARSATGERPALPPSASAVQPLGRPPEATAVARN